MEPEEPDQILFAVAAPDAVVGVGRHPEFEGRVISIQINSGPSVQYLVGWWNGREWVEKWLPPSEINFVRQSIRVGVGFRRPDFRKEL